MNINASVHVERKSNLGCIQISRVAVSGNNDRNSVVEETIGRLRRRSQNSKNRGQWRDINDDVGFTSILDTKLRVFTGGLSNDMTMMLSELRCDLELTVEASSLFFSITGVFEGL